MASRKSTLKLIIVTTWNDKVDVSEVHSVLFPFYLSHRARHIDPTVLFICSIY